MRKLHSPLSQNMLQTLEQHYDYMYGRTQTKKLRIKSTEFLFIKNKLQMKCRINVALVLNGLIIAINLILSKEHLNYLQNEDTRAKLFQDKFSPVQQQSLAFLI